jgi:hypothetical protein
VVVELDVASLGRLSPAERGELCETVARMTRAHGIGTVRLEPYRNGSAFLGVGDG